MRNNRRAGHDFERRLRLWFRNLGWDRCETTRYASRELDDQCIDLKDTDPFQVQAKYTQQINIHRELSKMPKNEKMNLLFHKRKNKGIIVAMTIEDFEELLNMLISEKII